MNSSSRHSRQRGDARAHNLESEGEITAYKEQQNRRRKALHDEVQKALLDSGFGEAVELRPLFTGELSDKEAIGETSRTVSCTHRKTLP